MSDARENVQSTKKTGLGAFVGQMFRSGKKKMGKRKMKITNASKYTIKFIAEDVKAYGLRLNALQVDAEIVGVAKAKAKVKLSPQSVQNSTKEQTLVPGKSATLPAGEVLRIEAWVEGNRVDYISRNFHPDRHNEFILSDKHFPLKGDAKPERMDSKVQSGSGTGTTRPESTIARSAGDIISLVTGMKDQRVTIENQSNFIIRVTAKDFATGGLKKTEAKIGAKVDVLLAKAGPTAIFEYEEGDFPEQRFILAPKSEQTVIARSGGLQVVGVITGPAASNYEDNKRIARNLQPHLDGKFIFQDKHFGLSESHTGPEAHDARANVQSTKPTGFVARAKQKFKKRTMKIRNDSKYTIKYIAEDTKAYGIRLDKLKLNVEVVGDMASAKAEVKYSHKSAEIPMNEQTLAPGKSATLSAIGSVLHIEAWVSGKRNDYISRNFHPEYTGEFRLLDKHFPLEADAKPELMVLYGQSGSGTGHGKTRAKSIKARSPVDIFSLVTCTKDQDVTIENQSSFIIGVTAKDYKTGGIGLIKKGAKNLAKVSKLLKKAGPTLIFEYEDGDFPEQRFILAPGSEQTVTARLDGLQVIGVITNLADANYEENKRIARNLEARRAGKFIFQDKHFPEAPPPAPRPGQPPVPTLKGNVPPPAPRVGRPPVPEMKTNNIAGRGRSEDAPRQENETQGNEGTRNKVKVEGSKRKVKGARIPGSRHRNVEGTGAKKHKKGRRKGAQGSPATTNDRNQQ